MKVTIVLMLMFSLSSHAQKSSVGEKSEPQCGEPCATCPGGIRQCDKTLNTAPRAPKIVEETNTKGRFSSSKKGASKQ